MTVETTRSALLWCSIINYVLLALWGLVSLFARDWVQRLNTRLLGIPAEKFVTINYTGIMFYKMAVFLFNIVPCIALYIVA